MSKDNAIPVALAFIAAMMIFIIYIQIALFSSVRDHHEKDILREEANTVFATKFELMACSKNLDDKMNFIIAMLQNYVHDKEKVAQ